MKIHEYQARELLRTYGLPIPASQTIDSIEQAAHAFKAVTAAGAKQAVIKAQVHAGGRGKAGFVKLVSTPDYATTAARFMLTNRMKSPQTPPEGLEVKKLLVAAAVDIAHEFYMAITVDRKTRRNVLIASREGGVEIEEVAKKNPSAIIKEALHPLLGLQGHQARKVAFQLGFTGKLVGQAVAIMQGLAKVFVEKDCSLAEINPLVLVPAAAAPAAKPSGAGSSPGTSFSEGTLLAIDAKFNFDDNGLFRHGDIGAMADPAEENPAELRAQKYGLSYIALDGSIGCLVNGAGLAMSTMDIVKLHGMEKGIEPANFLDVGGGATEEAVTAAFDIILSDPKVKGVLVNIFGGIMRCDVIAQGIVNAARGFKNTHGPHTGEIGFKVPLVVRLEGTNVEAGRKLLSDAKKDIPTMQAATDLTDAARKICAAVG